MYLEVVYDAEIDDMPTRLCFKHAVLTAQEGVDVTPYVSADTEHEPPCKICMDEIDKKIMEDV